MRLLVLAVTVLAVPAMVYTERCSDTAACTSQRVTVCEQNSTLICASTIHFCVCIMPPKDNADHCTDKADCPNCTGMMEPHCLDKRCLCAPTGGALLG